MSAFVKTYENVLTSRPESGVALGTLNRPKAVQKRPTALNTELSVKPNVALCLLDADGEIGSIVMADSERRSPSNER
jgi:enoyl-CoA hydratase